MLLGYIIQAVYVNMSRKTSSTCRRAKCAEKGRLKKFYKLINVAHMLFFTPNIILKYNTLQTRPTLQFSIRSGTSSLLPYVLTYTDGLSIEGLKALLFINDKWIF